MNPQSPLLSLSHQSRFLGDADSWADFATCHHYLSRALGMNLFTHTQWEDVHPFRAQRQVSGSLCGLPHPKTMPLLVTGAPPDVFDAYFDKFVGIECACSVRKRLCIQLDVWRPALWRRMDVEGGEESTAYRKDVPDADLMVEVVFYTQDYWRRLDSVEQTLVPVALVLFRTHGEAFHVHNWVEIREEFAPEIISGLLRLGFPCLPQFEAHVSQHEVLECAHTHRDLAALAPPLGTPLEVAPPPHTLVPFLSQYRFDSFSSLLAPPRARL